jgi:hypothetical protein
LIYYGSGAPAYTPTTNKNAYHYVDTTTDVFWHWDFTSMLWDTVTVSGGGGGGTDSQVIDTFTYASDTLRLSMSGDGQMYKYVVIPGSSDDQTIDTLSFSSDTLRVSLSGDGQKYKSVYLPADTDDQSLSYGTKTGNTIPLNITGGSGVNLDQGTNIEITRDAQ